MVLTWCVVDRGRRNLSRCCRSRPYRGRRPCHWCGTLPDTGTVSLVWTLLGPKAGARRDHREPTESLDSLARRTVQDRLAVLTFVVATVEPSRAGTDGVLLGAAYLQGPLVAVWKSHREPSQRGQGS